MSFGFGFAEFLHLNSKILFSENVNEYFWGILDFHFKKGASLEISVGVGVGS